MWESLTLFEKIMGVISGVLISILIYYTSIRLLMYAAFKSLMDAQKTFKKEEKDVIQKKSRKI